jgi:hypothetical protein
MEHNTMKLKQVINTDTLPYRENILKGENAFAKKKKTITRTAATIIILS